ncbi:hypothetical protein EC991_003426 [Linnemannia zychae]|nr:hypothetical protein EC991_003426 [Linnemannia zychae]
MGNVSPHLPGDSHPTAAASSSTSCWPGVGIMNIKRFFKPKDRNPSPPKLTVDTVNSGLASSYGDTFSPSSPILNVDTVDYGFESSYRDAFNSTFYFPLQSPTSPKDRSDYPMIIGIDFGEKRAVVSFAVRKDGEALDIYYNFRGVCSRTMAMVSLYKRSSKDIVDWGNSALQTMMTVPIADRVVLRDIRLQLDEPLKVPPLVSHITPLKAITDYLRLLRENVEQELQGSRYTAADYQYWIAVPGHWSDRAKDIMRQAATGAGLVKESDPPHRLMLISEDEAAAFRCARSTGKFRFENTDLFMVCNVREGGGVTLTMLEVTEMVAGQVKGFKEVDSSHGTDNVPASIDANMRRLLEYKLKGHLSNMTASGLDDLMDKFRETVKQDFDGDDTQYLRTAGVGLDRDDVLADLRAGSLVLSSSELTSKVFEPAIVNVLPLIQDMLNTTLGERCKAIFVIGESGAPVYLSARVRRALFLRKVLVVSALADQYTVVASGAVHAGLASSLQDRAKSDTSPSTSDDPLLHLSTPRPRVPSAPRLSHVMPPKPPGYPPFIQPSVYSSFNMNSVGGTLPRIFVPQTNVSSGTVTSDPGHIQAGGYPPGPASNNLHSTTGKDGGMYGYTVSTAEGGAYSTNNDYSNHRATSYSYVPPTVPHTVATAAGNNNNQQTSISLQTSSALNSTSTPDPQSDVQTPHTYSIVMAIDFGTKFSKVSFGPKDHKDKLCDISSWPVSLSSEMTPTFALYKKGSTEIQDWGHMARIEKTRSPQDYCLLRNLRLQLDESIDAPPFENGITPLKAISDYLRRLNVYALSRMSKAHFSKQHGPQNVQYCLTVPAKWSNRAKSTMRQAAIKAELIQARNPSSRLVLISEDEAMATYCMHMMADNVELKDKDRFMICNASEGGGVDVVVFEVSEPVGETKRLLEIARMHSENCGSDFLDANMERFLEFKLRKYRTKIPAHGWNGLMENFLFIRSFFNNEESDNVVLQAPGGCGMDSIDDKDIGLEEGLFIFDHKEVKEKVFEPAVEDVLELIQDLLQRQQQLGGTCKALFMLGEFGYCRYMLSRAKAEFKDRIELVDAPAHPSLAIPRGAVMALLDS